MLHAATFGLQGPDGCVWSRAEQNLVFNVLQRDKLVTAAYKTVTYTFASRANKRRETSPLTLSPDVPNLNAELVSGFKHEPHPAIYLWPSEVWLLEA